MKNVRLIKSFSPKGVQTAAARIYLLLIKKLLILILSLGIPGLLTAQISVTATAGTAGPTSYTTLKASFDAINAGTHQGVITIAITANTSETSSASLNASGSGSASYTGITISPSGGAARTISGSIADGLIKLNGADNVTIDGLNTGSNSLIISNTSTSGVSILFTNDATNNTITNF